MQSVIITVSLQGWHIMQYSHAECRTLQCYAAHIILTPAVAEVAGG